MKCQQCGNSSSDDHKFCGQCGSRLGDSFEVAQPPEFANYTPPHLAESILRSRSALEGERKQVTVLFCDIANSTPLAASIGAENMHKLLNAFFKAVLGEVHRYGGTINQFLGDGFMALFGAPVAHEDHARRAVLAALAIEQVVSAVVASDSLAAASLQLRIGLHTGPVVVGRIGDNLRGDYTAVGDTTNIAARLQSEADPGTVLISETLFRIVDPYVLCDSLGMRVLKGRSEPISVYRLRSARQVGRSSVSIGALVGREAEIGLLQNALQRLEAGDGGILNIVGETGLGKSRLLEEGRLRAQQHGLLWAQGSCVSFGKYWGYWPFREVLCACLSIGDTGSDKASWQKLDSATRRLLGGEAEQMLPFIGALLALPLPDPLAERLRLLDGLSVGHQIFRCALRLVASLAQQQPVAMVFEDWHWADASSADLLTHLLPLSNRLPILFIVANRPESTGAAEALRRWLQGGQESIGRSTTFRLMPLPAREGAQLIAKLLGGGVPPSAIRDTLLRRSGGNPFYLGELVRALVESGGLERNASSGKWTITERYAAMPLPSTIEGVILDRIDRLNEHAKHVLKAAAVVGRTFQYRLLRAVVGNESAVDHALLQLQRAELIDEKLASSEAEYVFRHPLIQQAAYESVLEDRRREMHLRAGRGIEDLFADRLAPFHSILAYHFAKAEDWGKAQDYLFKAAEQADRLAADEEALALYEVVIAAAEQHPIIGLGSFRRAQLDRKLADAHFRAGRHEQALATYAQALRRLGVQAPRLRWRWRTVAAVVSSLAWHALRQRLIATGSDPNPIRPEDALCAEIWQAMTFIHFHIDPLLGAHDCTRIVRLTRRHSDQQTHIVGLGNIAMTLTAMGLYKLAAEYLEELRPLVERYGDELTRARADHFHAVYLHHIGEWVAAVDFAQRACERCWATGNLRAWAAFVGNSVRYMYSLGQPGWIALAERLAQVAGETADRQTEGWSLSATAQACEHRGDYEGALEMTQRACEIYEAIPDERILAHTLSQRSISLRRLGRLVEAERCCSQAVALIRHNHYLGSWCTTTWLAAADFHLLVLESKGGHASAAVRRAASSAVGAMRRQGVRVRDEGTIEAQRVAGIHAWLCGEPERARSFWSSAIRESERLGAVHSRARILFERGTRLNAAADLELAEALFYRSEALGELEMLRQSVAQRGRNRSY